MLAEDIMEQPNRHTASLTALLQELEQLHKQSLADAEEEIYEELYTAVLTAIVEIRRRSGGVALGKWRQPLWLCMDILSSSKPTKRPQRLLGR